MRNLYIIGNGFDLQCGLRSSFKDFFITECLPTIKTYLRKDYWNPVEFNIYNIEKHGETKNLFYILFYFCFMCFKDNPIRSFIYGNSIPSSEWYDVELFLTKLFNKAHAKSPYEMIKDIYIGFCSNDRYREEGDFEALSFYIAGFLHNKNKKGEQIPTFRDFFINELNRFEKHFKKYLIKISTNNKNYKSKKKQLIKNVLGMNNFDSVLNFNYTSLFAGPDAYETNVHGNLSSQIIIGIDNAYVTNDNDCSLFCSKTFKKMTYDTCKQKQLLDKDIENIYFYGHSLGEQDYSYFQSIFDYLNIYDSQVCLHFYYSDNFYDDTNKKKALEENSIRIYKLINRYGETLDNKDNGRNLLHKLILENRLTIKVKQLSDAKIKATDKQFPKEEIKMPSNVEQLLDF